jgi:hypothetical protein
MSENPYDFDDVELDKDIERKLIILKGTYLLTNLWS